MSNGNLIICDPEEGYAQALAYYLMHKKEFGMEVQVYDRIEKVQEIADRTKIQILFAAAEYEAEERKKVPAVNANVLYLNLELYSGIGGHFAGEGQTLSDLLYYARQEKGNLGLFLTTIVQHRRHLDYVHPMAVAEDVKAVSVQEWKDLLTKIAEQSIYEMIVLDIDEGLPQVYQLLRVCTEVHVPEIRDRYAQAKIRQFEQELTLLGYEDVLQKIKRKDVHD